MHNAANTRVIKMKLNMIAIIVALLIIPTIAQAEQQRVYQLTLQSDGTAITLKDIKVTTGAYYEQPYPTGRYEARLLAFDNTILNKQNFDFDFQIADSPPPPEWFDKQGKQIFFPNRTGERQRLSTALVELIIPYHPTGMRIDIIDTETGQTALQINVMQYAKTCGDNTCQPHENYQSCSSDCQSGGKDSYCDGIADSKCDPDCINPDDDTDCKEQAGQQQTEQQPAAKQGKWRSPAAMAAAALLIITIATCFKILSSRRKKQQPPAGSIINAPENR